VQEKLVMLFLDLEVGRMLADVGMSPLLLQAWAMCATGRGMPNHRRPDERRVIAPVAGALLWVLAVRHGGIRIGDLSDPFWWHDAMRGELTGIDTGAVPGLLHKIFNAKTTEQKILDELGDLDLTVKLLAQFFQAPRAMSIVAKDLTIFTSHKFAFVPEGEAWCFGPRPGSGWIRERLSEAFNFNAAVGTLGELSNLLRGKWDAFSDEESFLVAVSKESLLTRNEVLGILRDSKSTAQALAVQCGCKIEQDKK
jgi:hypothetical protein